MHIAHILLEKMKCRREARWKAFTFIALLLHGIPFSLYGWLCHTVKIITFSMSMSLKKRRRHELEWILLDFFWYGFSLYEIPSDLCIRFFYHPYNSMLR